jgi:long-chain fatty acid transport protein
MKRNVTLTLGLLAASTPLATHAGGLFLYEDATSAVGLAGAGFAARAQDASTLSKNPAGMSLLPGSQFTGGLELLVGNITLTPNSQTSSHLGGNNGGNAFPLLPEGSAYFTHQLSDKFTLGLGMMSYFGLAEEYNSDWVGRYYVKEGALLGISFLPTVSYKINEWLAVGAGMNAMNGMLNSKVAVNNFSIGGPAWSGGDGQLKIDDNNWGFGATAGAIIKLSEKTRLGLSYLSRVNLDFSDVPEWSNLRPGLETALNNRGLLNANLDLGVTVPQQVMGGLYHELNDKWSVMVDAGWQNWEKFGYVSVGVASDDPTSLTLDNQYQNTWHLGGGAIYKHSDKWSFTGGVGYDSSAVSDANRTVTLPMGQQWRFGLGAMWQVSRKVNVGAAWDLIWMGDMSVDQYRGALAGRVAGTYEGAYVNVFALNLNWKL